MTLPLLSDLFIWFKFHFSLLVLFHLFIFPSFYSIQSFDFLFNFLVFFWCVSQGSYGLVKLAYSEEDSTHYAMKILSKKRLLKKAGLMGRGPKKGITSPLERVYREIAVLKKVSWQQVSRWVGGLNRMDRRIHGCRTNGRTNGRWWIKENMK